MLYSVCIYLSFYYKLSLKTLNINSKYDVFGCIIFYLIIISNNIFKYFPIVDEQILSKSL